MRYGLPPLFYRGDDTVWPLGVSPCQLQAAGCRRTLSGLVHPVTVTCLLLWVCQRPLPCRSQGGWGAQAQSEGTFAGQKDPGRGCAVRWGPPCMSSLPCHWCRLNTWQQWQRPPGSLSHGPVCLPVYPSLLIFLVNAQVSGRVFLMFIGRNNRAQMQTVKVGVQREYGAGLRQQSGLWPPEGPFSSLWALSMHQGGAQPVHDPAVMMARVD